jgi:hypothetical protein
MSFYIMIIVLYYASLPMNVNNMAISSIMGIIQKMLVQKCREINKISKCSVSTVLSQGYLDCLISNKGCVIVDDHICTH